MLNKKLRPDEYKRIAELIDIKSVIGKVVNLKRAGGYYRGCCPFHNEKSASFIVYHKDSSSFKPNSFHCYGGQCGEHGNVIDFVQKYYNLTNYEAMEWLSKEFNIPLDYEDHEVSPEDIRKEWLWRLNEAIVNILNQNLINQPENSDVKRYLRDRGIVDNDIIKWKIGFGSDQFIKDNCLNKTFSAFSISKVVDWNDFRDLDIDKEHFFTNRIIFPIFDLQGRPVAFSNRIFAYDENKEKQKEIEKKLLSEYGGKYINTGIRHSSNDGPKGSILYESKTLHLYGLHIARQHIRKNGGKLVVVEGNIDVISCHRNGLENFVGLLSATLNEDTVETLKKCSVKRLILCLDGDAGGVGGSERIAKNIQNGRIKVSDKDYSCEISIASLPEDPLVHDPDSYLLLGSADGLKSVLNEAKCISEYLIDRRLANNKFESLTEKIEFIHAVKGDLNTERDVPEIEKILAIESLTKKLDIPKEIIKEHFNLRDGHISDKLVSEISEKVVLAEMIEDEESRTALLNKISSEDYYYTSNRTMHKIIFDMDANRLPIDYNILQVKCREEGFIGTYFNDNYFQALKNTVRANVDFHAEKVIEYSKKRQLHQFGNKVKESIFEKNDVLNLISDFSKDLYTINSSGDAEAFKGPRDEALEYANIILKRCRNPGVDMGLQMGYPVLDNSTQGLFPGQVMLILARTSDGKTALAQNIVCNMALRQNNPIPVYYANLEMEPSQMMDRMMSIYTGIHARDIVSGYLDRTHEEELMRAIHNYATKNSLFIKFFPDFTLSKLSTQLRYYIEKFGVKLAVIDYVQLMAVEKEFMGMSTSEQLGMISRGITGLAKSLKIPIIIIAQANRDTVTGNQGRPELQNIYGSDKFSHDVDIAVSLQSKTMKQQEADGWLNPEEMLEKGYRLRDESGSINQSIYEKLKVGKRGNYWLHILKNRKGQKDTKIHYWFHKFRITFEEVNNSLENA